MCPTNLVASVIFCSRRYCNHLRRRYAWLIIAPATSIAAIIMHRSVMDIQSRPAEPQRIIHVTPNATKAVTTAPRGLNVFREVTGTSSDKRGGDLPPYACPWYCRSLSSCDATIIYRKRSWNFLLSAFPSREFNASLILSQRKSIVYDQYNLNVPNNYSESQTRQLLLVRLCAVAK